MTEIQDDVKRLAEIKEYHKRYIRRKGLGQYTTAGEDIGDLLRMLEDISDDRDSLVRTIEYADDGCTCMAVTAAVSRVRNEEDPE